MHQTFAQIRTIRTCNTEANLANGIYNPETENKFSVAIFLKKKSTNQKKNWPIRFVRFLDPVTSMRENTD